MVNAVLIIAHKNIDQVIRLVKTMNVDSFDFYIHLDKKWKLQSNDIQRLKNISDHVTVLDKRISGFLDTWSLCEITIELIRTAINSNQKYGYYILLSGQDYPIKSPDKICLQLEKLYPKPLIDCTPMVKDNWIYSGFKWIRFHPYYRMVERISDNRVLRKLLLLPAYFIQLIVTYVIGSPYKRLSKLNCELYGGSAWWILPDEVVKLCVDEVDNNTDIVRAFKLKNTPEETFFQTMVMRSRLCHMVDLNEPYEILQNCMTYAYFFDEDHEATGHPYILTSQNLEMLKKRKEFFARKFDITIDTKILDLLDENYSIKEG